MKEGAWKAMQRCSKTPQVKSKQCVPVVGCSEVWLGPIQHGTQRGHSSSTTLDGKGWVIALVGVVRWAGLTFGMGSLRIHVRREGGELGGRGPSGRKDSQ